MTGNINKVTKTCTKCGETKPIEEFSRKKAGLYGRQSHCKTCASVTRKAHYAANRGHELANVKAWYEANKEHSLAGSKARNKAWHAANRERKSAARKARYAANPGRESARNKAWHEANPEAQAAYGQRRRATKLRQTPLTWFTQKEIDKQFARVKRHCRKQSKALGIQWDVDHVVPLNGMIGGTAGTKVVSGLHWGGNFAALPSKHNTSKQCYEWPDKWNYDNTYYDDNTGTLLERELNQAGD